MTPVHISLKSLLVHTHHQHVCLKSVYFSHPTLFAKAIELQKLCKARWQGQCMVRQPLCTDDGGVCNQSLSYHRITEWPGLKRTTMIIEFQLPAVCTFANHQTRLPRATSSLALNASRDEASTASLGNLFQCISTLCVKNFLLISNLNLPCLSLKPFPLVLLKIITIK